MGKTNAERQKAYRERKKSKEGAAYLKKETERVKRYYIPTNEISLSKLKTRREKVRDCMRKRRSLLKQTLRENSDRDREIQSLEEVHALDVIEESAAGPCDSTTSVSLRPDKAQASSSSGRLLVNLKFKTKRGTWKRSKALKRAKDKVKSLELKVACLTKRNDALRKKMQRSLSARSPIDTGINTKINKGQHPKKPMLENDHLSMSPRSRSVAELRNEGLSPSKHKNLVKKLTFHNTLVQEVKEKVKADRGRSRQRTSLEVVCGKMMKKYRLGSMYSREMETHRNQIRKAEIKHSIAKRRQALERAHAKTQVVKFLERCDNSAILPGKRDATKSKDGAIQLIVLNDYLYNLHLKFKAENPSMSMSLTTFSSYRPAHIRPVKFSSRRTCLCQKHHSMVLKVKGLRLAGVLNTDNPDNLIRQNTDEEILEKVTKYEADTVKYSQWKKREVSHKGKVTKRMVLENVEIPKTDFIEMFRNDLISFRSHVERVHCQYQQVHLLKEKLPRTHAICQMDFAENYTCGYVEEPQNAYFDKCPVTLHPTVVYTRSQSGTLEHKSYVYVSDTQTHNSGTVFAFMKHITDELKANHPDIECIHYITDSPTSQYRNKTMMYVVANHFQLFGMSSSWQYWEAGHGKGPCDGVGGTSKRLADMAVKRCAAVIQSARDYCDWGMTQTVTAYRFVSKEECERAHNELSVLKLKPIPGTLEIHSVMPVQSGEIAVRNTSCFCEKCFNNGTFTLSCDGWVRHSLKASKDVEMDMSITSPESAIQSEESIQTELDMSITRPEPAAQSEESLQSEELFAAPIGVNSYVVALYNGKWYIGKVVAYDSEDESLPYQISFMEHGKGKVELSFKWPSKEDIIWTQREDILCTINEPVPYGTRKMFKLHVEDHEKVAEFNKQC